LIYYYTIHNIVNIQTNIPLIYKGDIPPLEEVSRIIPNIKINIVDNIVDPKIEYTKIDKYIGSHQYEYLLFKDVYYKRRYELLLDKTIDNVVKIFATKATTKLSHPKICGNLYDLIDDIIRIKLIESGYTHIHAGCVSKNNEAILLAGFAGVGKTKAVFDLLKSGYSYISDDKVLVDNKCNAYFSYVPSTISHEDFSQYNKVPFSVRLKSSLLRNRPFLMKYFPLPKIDLLKDKSFKSERKSKISTVCFLEEGDRNIEEVAFKDVVQKIHRMNQYSMGQITNNRFLWMYSYFNKDFDLSTILLQDYINLRQSLSNSNCYVLSCRDRDWVSLVRKIVNE